MSHVELRERDRAARIRAQTEFATPIVLEAGAGTGKTATLVARVLAWSLGPGWERHAALGEGDAAIAARVLERTSAITFTEAAAAEMAERVARGLGEVAAGRPPIGADVSALPPTGVREPRARALLGQVDRLVVRTIHAFCRRLLAAFPLEAGVHPSFEVDADGTLGAQVVREVLEERLREAYASPGDPDCLALAARGCGPGELEELLVRALEAGLPAEALERDPLDAATIAALLARGAGALEAFRACEAGRLASVGGRSNTPAADEGLRVLAAQLGSTGRTREDLDALAAWLRDELEPAARDRLGKWSRGDFTKGEARALGAAQDELSAASRELFDWLELVCALHPLHLEAARRVVRPLLDDLYRALRARGVASFGSLLIDARRLVLEHPAVRARIQDDTDQLLVDEFQDTDAVQCEIVRAIGLGGDAARRPGLFVVGDPKQSIYGWRQADLAAYERFVSDVLAAGGQLEHLHLNFRSRPEVLAEVHELIAPVMLEAPGLQPRYQELVPDREPAGGARVEHWVSWPAEPESGERAPARAADCAALEARALAADLLRRHAEGVPWQELAVLMRSRSDLEVYLEALRAAGVPFDVEGDRSYYRRREIIDAGALVRCVIDPNDHLSLVTWLRSPSVGLPDAALVPLWLLDLPRRVTDLREPGTPALAEVVALVREVAGELPPVPGLERIEGWADSVCAALELLAALRQSFETDPPDVFVERLRTWSLIEATEAARYLGRYRVANLEGFLRRLGDDLCESGGDPAAILRALRRRVREAEEEEEARPKDASDDAVQVRTIHQAKGLDWDHVYLVQAHKRLPTGDEPRVCGTVDGVWEYRLFDAPTPGHPRLLERYAEIARAEQVRTLYVALTRARERLVVAANWQPERAAAAPLEAWSHEELLRRRAAGLPDLAACFRAREDWRGADGPLWRFPGHEGAAASASPRAHPLAGRLATLAQIERDARTLAALGERARRHMERPYRSGASSAELEAHRARRAGTAGPGRSVAAAVGSALHQILEHFDPGAEATAERARHEALLPALLEVLVEPADLETALPRARELLARLHDGPLVARLRALGNDVARELPLLAAPADAETGPAGCWAGVIDLLYRDPESGEWVVADYKTDRARNAAEIAELRERYAPQGAVYTAAVQTALDLREPPRFELWLLDAGRIERVAPVQSAAP